MNPLDRFQQIDRSRDLDSWSIRIFFWSRSTRVLGLCVAVILLAAAGVAWTMAAPDSEGRAQKTHQLRRELASPKPRMEAIARAISEMPLEEAAFIFVEEEISNSKLRETDKTLVTAMLDSLALDPPEPSADLLYLAHYVHPVRHANECLGDLHRRAGNTEGAVDYYTREARFPDAQTAREKLISIHCAAGNYGAATAAFQDPRFAGAFSTRARLRALAGSRQWKELIQPLLTFSRDAFQPIPLLLTAISGIVWLAIAIQAIQPPRWFCFRTVAPAIAVLAGMASTLPTLFAVLWQEEVWGLKHTGDFLSDLPYYILGVGPREELIKLAFVLPFLPVLLARKDRLAALIVAGAVGLGFGVQENLQYFAEAGATAAFARFLTANFFHFAATGLIGLALFDCCRAPRSGILPFLGTVAAVVLAHGCYDAFIIQGPDLIALNLISTMSFMLLSLFFFQKLRQLRDPATDHLSIGGTLVIGMAVLTGTALVCASISLGFSSALAALAFTAFSMVMVTYMFHWQLGEGMSHAAAEEIAAYRPFAQV